LRTIRAEYGSKFRVIIFSGVEGAEKVSEAMRRALMLFLKNRQPLKRSKMHERFENPVRADKKFRIGYFNRLFSYCFSLCQPFAAVFFNAEYSLNAQKIDYQKGASGARGQLERFREKMEVVYGRIATIAACRACVILIRGQVLNEDARAAIQRYLRQPSQLY